MAKVPARLPRSREPSQPALSYEHIENFTKDLEVRRDLGNRASPVNRAHMKRPPICNSLWSAYDLKISYLTALCQVGTISIILSELAAVFFKTANIST